MSAWFGGAMLLFALCRLWRHGTSLGWLRLELAALALAALWQGCVWRSLTLLLLALLLAGFAALQLPRLLLAAGPETPPPAALLPLGFGVAALAFLAPAPRPASLAVPPDGRLLLSLALALLLLGLLAAAGRGGRARIAGGVSAGNGLVLALVCLPGIPFAAFFAVAVLAPFAALPLLPRLAAR